MKTIRWDENKIQAMRIDFSRYFTDRTVAVFPQWQLEPIQGEQICLILGDVDGAIDAQKQMLQVTREDWTTEGEGVNAVPREIRRLEGMKQQTNGL